MNPAPGLRRSSPAAGALSRFLRFRLKVLARLVAELAEEARRVWSQSIARPLLSLPCAARRPELPAPQAPLRLDETDDLSACAWASWPETSRIPALIQGVAQRFELSEARVVNWSARHVGFDAKMLRQTKASAVPLPFIQAEIDVAVRAMAPATVPVYFGLELINQPGNSIDVKPAHVRDMVRACRAANAAWLVISCRISMHAPRDGL